MLFLNVSLFNFEAVVPSVGDDRDEVTPVPLPNTEVKLIFADNTRRVTAREDKLSPALKIVTGVGSVQCR